MSTDIHMYADIRNYQAIICRQSVSQLHFHDFANIGHVWPAEILRKNLEKKCKIIFKRTETWNSFWRRVFYSVFFVFAVLVFMFLEAILRLFWFLFMFGFSISMSVYRILNSVYDTDDNVKPNAWTYDTILYCTWNIYLFRFILITQNNYISTQVVWEPFCSCWSH
jgi:hypothetical protein